MLTPLIESSRRVGKLITEISEASAAQLTGIQHVDHAVTQMDASTQENAAIVEQAAAAAEHMAGQAEVLVAAVSRFRTGDGITRPAPTAPQVAAASPAPAAGPAPEPPASPPTPGARQAPPAPPRKPRAVAVSDAEAEEWKEF